MGFLVTTLIFFAIGIVASLAVRLCCNRGPSTNLLHLTLVLTATVCCWMMLYFAMGNELWGGILPPDITFVNVADAFANLQGWAIVYLAQLKPLIVPILNEAD